MELKEKAVKYLEQLKIYKPYINGFKSKGQKVCFYENFGGFWVYQEPEIEKKMHEIEKKYNAVCYAITHEYTDFGECWDFLITTKADLEADDNELRYIKDYNSFYALAYVYNKSCPECSELGTIGVQSFGGGIRRVF